jgi:hypothetical protein
VDELPQAEISESKKRSRQEFLEGQQEETIQDSQNGVKRMKLDDGMQMEDQGVVENADMGEHSNNGMQQ